MRTAVYVDALNLYKRRLEKAKYQCKWLDLMALCREVLPGDSNITKILYFAANVLGDRDPNAPERQRIYIAALDAHIPEFEFKGDNTKTKQSPRTGHLEKIWFDHAGGSLDLKIKLTPKASGNAMGGLSAVRGRVIAPGRKGGRC